MPADIHCTFLHYSQCETWVFLNLAPQVQHYWARYVHNTVSNPLNIFVIDYDTILYSGLDLTQLYKKLIYKVRIVHLYIVF